MLEVAPCQEGSRRHRWLSSKDALHTGGVVPRTPPLRPSTSPHSHTKHKAQEETMLVLCAPTPHDISMGWFLARDPAPDASTSQLAAALLPPPPPPHRRAAAGSTGLFRSNSSAPPSHQGPGTPHHAAARGRHALQHSATSALAAGVDVPSSGSGGSGGCDNCSECSGCGTPQPPSTRRIFLAKKLLAEATHAFSPSLSINTLKSDMCRCVCVGVCLCGWVAQEAKGNLAGRWGRDAGGVAASGGGGLRGNGCGGSQRAEGVLRVLCVLRAQEHGRAGPAAVHDPERAGRRAAARVHGHALLHAARPRQPQGAPQLPAACARDVADCSGGSGASFSARGVFLSGVEFTRGGYVRRWGASCGLCTARVAQREAAPTPL